MKKYTIEFKKKKLRSSSYFEIKINEKVLQNEALGDLICICKEDNTVEVFDCIDVDDIDVIEFIKEHFKDYRAVLGFIRKAIEV